MRYNESRLMRLKENLTQVMAKLKAVPEDRQDRAAGAIDVCRDCLDSVPPTDTPVYVHVMGTDKSFKTSYLLDLFDHDGLRSLFSVKAHNTSENTAVPCLVEPAESVSRIVIRQLSISTRQVMREDVTPDQFGRLYDLSMGAVPEDYLLQVLVPAGETPMTLPVIEYPGIKEGADALDTQRRQHKVFEKNLMDTLERFPGILVACFQHKIAIPLGHPMDIVLRKYREVLETGPLAQKLPLVVSMQGASAVSGYCGNTNVIQDIQADFKSHTAFDTVIQLVNPSNEKYPVGFGPSGPHVMEWISRLSRYDTLETVKGEIQKDGGIQWSRSLLVSLCETDTIQEALDAIFLAPWVSRAEACLEKALATVNEIETHDETAEVRERIRQAIIHGRYRPIRSFFTNELAIQDEGIVEHHERFWTGIFSQYLMQFFDDDDLCRRSAGQLWENLRQRLDGAGKGFIGTREEDLPYIIMNSAEMYVPNALIRGEIALIERALEEQ